MSDVVGAELAGLEELSASYNRAGVEMAGDAGDLRTRIGQAVERFTSVLDTLVSDAAALTQTIDAEIDAVVAQAAGVQWTGANRGAFDGDVVAFRSAVTKGTSELNADIGSIRSQVSSSFTPVLEEFSTALNTSVEGVGESTTTMTGVVSRQRDALDQAANVGWTNA